MRFRLALGCVVLATAPVACAENEDVVMPDVMTKRLDVALSDLERAGVEDEAELLGGGTFGVIDESNWYVCEQEPTAGGVVGSIPRLTVDRSCDTGNKPKGNESETETEPEAKPDKDSDEGGSGNTREPRSRDRDERGGGNANVVDTFVMPVLVGMNLQDAQDRLQASGSYFLTQTDGTGLGRFQVLDSGWKVCGQLPAAGSTTALSTIVELIAVKVDESC
jgi:beta-lactam-binding protein with PASTA domain